jgi:predicted transglutaminase-like cysteine proteinase
MEGKGMNELLAILTAINIQVNTAIEYEYRRGVADVTKNGWCPERGNCADIATCKLHLLTQKGIKANHVICHTPKGTPHMLVKVSEYYLDNRFNEVRTFTDCK